MDSSSPTGGGSYTPPPPPQPPYTPPPPQLPAAGGEEIIRPRTPGTDPILVLVLNLVLVCVGYFLIGQWKKGIVAIVASLLIGLPTCFTGVGLVAIVTTIDGFLQAQHLQAGRSIGHWTFFNDHRG